MRVWLRIAALAAAGGGCARAAVHHRLPKVPPSSDLRPPVHGEENDLTDVWLIGNQHDDTVNARGNPARGGALHRKALIMPGNLRRQLQGRIRQSQTPCT